MQKVCRYRERERKRERETENECWDKKFMFSNTSTRTLIQCDQILRNFTTLGKL